MKSKRLLLAVTVIYAVILLLVRLSRPMFASLDRSGASPGCSDEILVRVENGSKDYVASLRERDCGATTDFVRSVYIDPTVGQGLSASEQPVAVANGQGISTIRWKDNRTLVVDYMPNETRFFQQQTSFGEFKILYQPHTSPLKGVSDQRTSRSNR